MKQFGHYFFTLIILAAVISSCNKNSVVTPPAEKIATASSDTTALVVAISSTGTIIYSGTVGPGNSIGAIGDFYINLSNGKLFGPKTASGWGTPILLVGPAGKPGTRIYSGSGAPASTLGVVGDFYLDETNFLLYGPKMPNDWGNTPISLQGPQGPEGNANVKTDVFSVGGASWLWNSQYVFETSAGSYTEYFTRYYVRMNNTITQDVLDNGLVLVYFTPSPVNNPNQWAPLPYQFDSSFGYTYNYVYVTAPGKVTLHYFFIQTSTTATLPTLSTYNDETRKFKIVTITGATGVFMLEHHVNLNDYNAVSRVTGLWQQDKLNN